MQQKFWIGKISTQSLGVIWSTFNAVKDKEKFFVLAQQ